MCKTGSVVIISFAVFAYVTSAHATELANCETATPVASRQQTLSDQDLPTVVVVKRLINEPLVRIENLRLESGLPKAPRPSVVLKFDVLNDTSLPLTDVVVRVSFLDKRSDDLDSAPARVVVGPVTVRVGETLRAGYVLSYEMLFRNLSSDCDCVPRVEVLSARLLPD